MCSGAALTPSSIGVFGPSTPLDNIPQDTIMRPTIIYGIPKLLLSLWSDYYLKNIGWIYVVPVIRALFPM